MTNELTRHEKMIMALSGEKVLIRLKDAEKRPLLDATVHFTAAELFKADFELSCGARIVDVEFKRIRVESGPVTTDILVTLDLY